MNVSDDELMAYVDGELDAERAAAVKVLIAERADVARRVTEQQSLRDQLRRSFEPVLRESVPSRLATAVSRGRVVGIASAALRRPRRTAWSTGLGLAAGVVLGVLLGPALLRFSTQGPNGFPRGADVAVGSTLEGVLSHRLASEQSSTESIRIGVSFVSKRSEYCRTFMSNEGARTVAGMACYSGGVWRIDALQAVHNGSTNTSGYRQAATSLPPLIVDAVNASIAGDTLNASDEKSARDKGWGAR